MKRETTKLLHDVQRACLEIQSFTDGISVDSMWNDRKLQLSLHKLLEMIGEGLNKLRQSEPDIVDTIPDLGRYVSLRHRITHGYDSVDYSVIWQVATEEVPALHRTVEELLANPDAEPIT